MAEWGAKAMILLKALKQLVSEYRSHARADVAADTPQAARP